jgi:KUP system potassium uptake protein
LKERLNAAGGAKATTADLFGILSVNMLLEVGCILLVLAFRESVKLAAAYGIAVTGTMAITSILYYIVARHTWGLSKWRAGHSHAFSKF